MILVIDNYDSFTYNLVQALGSMGADLKVVRNDQITVAEIARLKPEKIIISPGPCTPKEAGISRLMHGKTSLICHDGEGVYAGMPNPFEATRYHSLIVREDTLPPFLKVVSRTQDQNEVMGIRHVEWPLEGVQFHPESFLTVDGEKLLKNFLIGPLFTVRPGEKKINAKGKTKKGGGKHAKGKRD